MPRIPEIFRLDGQNDVPDDSGDPDQGGEADLPEDHDGDDPWLRALEREAVSHVIQGNQEWRCIRCDSDRAFQHGSGQWTCTVCQGSEFYATDQALRRQTDRGTWMFLPRTPNGLPEQAPPHDPPGQGPPRPISRRQRQQINRAARRGGVPPETPVDYDDELPESETAKFDSSVDPDDQDGLPRRLPPGQGGPPWRPTARPSSCPATPPTASSMAPRAKAKSKTAGKPEKPRLDSKEVMTSQVGPATSSSSSWNSLMGPSRGVRWRGGAPPTPPLWKYEPTDLRAYSKFAKKVALWRIQVASFMTPREASLVLYTSLTGEAEAELEHAPIEAINTDKGIDFILETLRQPMEQKQIFQKRKYLSDFEGIQRQPGEGLKAFSNRYRRIERNLKAVGVEVALMYDSEARGNRLLERARLTPQDQRLILVGARYSLAFEDVAESMAMQFPDFKGAPPVIGRDGQPINRSKGTGKGQASRPSKGQSTHSSGHSGKGGKHGGFVKKVYLADQNEEPQAEGEPEHDIPDDPEPEHDIADDHDPDHAAEDDGDFDQDEATDLAEVAEVLSVTAKKLSSMRLGRKFAGGPKKDAATLKRETHCAACGEKGHWRGDPECKVSGAGTAPPPTGAKGQDSTAPDLHGAPRRARLHRDRGRLLVRHDVQRQRGLRCAARHRRRCELPRLDDPGHGVSADMLRYGLGLLAHFPFT